MQQAALHHVHGEIQDMNSGEEWEHTELGRASGDYDRGKQQNRNRSPENNPA